MTTIGLKTGLMALALGVGGCGHLPAIPVPTPPATAATVTPLAAAVTQTLDRRVDAVMQVYAPVGLSVAILRGDRLVYERHAGVERLGGATPANGDTLYSVFSMSKLFFLIEMIRAEARGELDFDAPIATHVADLPGAWRGLTVRQLLSHVSGLPEYYSHPDVPQTVAAAFGRVRDADFISEPGSRSRYNQTNFLLAKLALEQVSGRAYADLVANDQFAPLGLDHMRYGGHALAEAGTIVSYRPDAATGDLAPEIYPTYPPYVWSSVGLNASLSDLAVWAGALVRGDLVPRRTLLDHWQPLPLSNGRPGAYADGWEYSDLGDFITVGHGGGNRVNFMHGFRKSDPSDTVTVIYLDNGGPSEIPTRRITTVLADALIPGFASPTQLLFEDLVTDHAAQGWPAALARLDAHIADRSLSPAEAEGLLNTVGYTLSATFGPEAALDAFRLNVARHPRSANPHDSLAETLLTLGDHAGALEHYRHALALNPDDTRVATIVAGLERQAGAGDDQT